MARCPALIEGRATQAAHGRVVRLDPGPRPAARVRRHPGAGPHPRVGAWSDGYGEDHATGRAHASNLLSIMSTAVEDELRADNPCRIRGDSQSPSAKRREGASGDQGEAIAAAMPEWLAAAVWLSAYCALRFGEVAELRRRRCRASRCAAPWRRPTGSRTWVCRSPLPACAPCAVWAAQRCHAGRADGPAWALHRVRCDAVPARRERARRRDCTPHVGASRGLTPSPEVTLARVIPMGVWRRSVNASRLASSFTPVGGVRRGALATHPYPISTSPMRACPRTAFRPTLRRRPGRGASGSEGYLSAGPSRGPAAGLASARPDRL